MKCAGCGTEHTFKDRSLGRCKSCGRWFVFEPKSGDPLTDVAFNNAIEAVSAGGRIRWGVEHLRYELCRRQRRGRRRLLVGSGLLALLAVAGGLLAAADVGIGFLLVFGGGVYSVALLVSATKSGIEQNSFDELWKRWVVKHGQPKGVIVRKPRPKSNVLKEADIAEYSFDRAVICDRARTVDLLLANNFHFEHNCAVLGIGGYPEHVFTIVRGMLTKNPRLQAYALHDVTLAGCRMAHQLSNDLTWFGGRVQVVDIGLRPRHATRHRWAWSDASVLVEPRTPGLEAGEVDWLRAFTMDLAVLRPEQILKAVSRAIATTRAAEESEVWVDTGSGGSSGSDGDVDAFG